MTHCRSHVTLRILLSIHWADRKQNGLMCEHTCRLVVRAETASSARSAAYVQSGRTTWLKCAGAGAGWCHTRCDLVKMEKLLCGGKTESNSESGFGQGGRR